MSLSRRIALLFILFPLLLSPLSAYAEVDIAADIPELSSRLQADIESLEVLDSRIEAASSQDREALLYRRDERNFRLLQDLDSLVRTTAALPEDDPQREEVSSRLRSYLDGAGQGVLRRIGELAERISALQADTSSQSGAQLISTEASIQSLEGLRFRYYEALVQVIEGLDELGQADAGFGARLLPMLYLQSEIMVGRIEFTAGALEELQQREAFEPDNADLKTVRNELARQQALDLAHLETMIGLLERLGQDPVNYQSVLLEQGQGLSITTLETDAVASLLQDSWTSLKQSLAERAPDFLFNLCIFVLILVVFRSLAGLTRRTVRMACERPGVDMSTLLKDVLISVCGGTVTVIGVLIALAQVGISLGPMLAGLGVAGFVIGFALQDTLGNFAAGGMILIYRPYDVDDFVEVAGASGLVKKMSLVSTTITTYDNQTLVIPNSKIWGDVIKNVTAQKVRRVDLVFGIGYGDDIPLAERILKDVVEGHDKVLDKPETMIKVHELADSSVNFVVRPWVKTDDYWDVYWDLTRAVKLRFDKEGISIPFPQRDVHVYREEA